jgi:hypothetical protein
LEEVVGGQQGVVPLAELAAEYEGAEQQHSVLAFASQPHKYSERKLVLLCLNRLAVT